ncbi:DUF4085 family protein [Roseateles noduli]|jgi:hypothetical protein|uniref:DUF4085 family protein n=1 Tax=Roseateles noduli TaxID=2052484 RepID=UPI003D650E51
MKFFTPAWRDAAGDPDLAVFRQYESYLASVRHRLPADLLRLWDDYTLHDARVVAVDTDVPGQRLSLVLNGWDQPLQHPMRYAMTFIGITAGGTLPEGVSIEELEDLGYVEMEALDVGVEFRMLFVSGIEWTIRCQDVAVETMTRTR